MLIDRRTIYQEQKNFFSGKQQSHTFKNSVISCAKGEDIIDVTVGARGPASDINLFLDTPHAVRRGDSWFNELS